MTTDPTTAAMTKHLAGLTLQRGAHTSRADGLCLLEAS